jgi:hypothetical protein
MADAEVVHEYGQDEPTFGGVYFDGDVVVAMFTADLDRHTRQLLPRLRAAEQFRIELTDQTYAQVEAANARVQRRLMLSDQRHPEVVGVGIGLRDGKFVVQLHVENLTDALAAEIQTVVAPDSVAIEQGSRPRRQ